MEADEIIQARHDAKKSGKAHTKSWWKDNCRMKPIDESEFEREYKNDYGQWCKLYNFEQCKPMRAKRPQTEAQKRTTQKMVLTNKLNSRLGRASIRAQRMLNEDVLIFDTETTGLNQPHMLSICVISSKSGEVLLDSLVHTKKEIEPTALELHGITLEMVKDAPTARDIWHRIQLLRNGRRMTAFNIDYDIDVVHRSVANGTEQDEEFHIWASCLMNLSVDAFGGNRHGRISLADALEHTGCTFQGAAHTAKADCLAALDVLRHIADYAAEIEKQIVDLEKRSGHAAATIDL